MLSKLIKHEFRATRRIILPLLGAIILLSVLAGGSIRMLDNNSDIVILNVIYAIFIGLYVISLLAIGVIVLVQMVERFRKNLLGEQGYLMLTLPVSVDEHIFAKLIVSVVWFFATALICLSVLITMSIAIPDFLPGLMKGITEVFGNVSEALKLIGNGSKGVGIAHTAALTLELIVLGSVSTASACLCFYAAMAIGHSFSNHKTLYSVFSFFGISIVFNIIGSILGQALVNAGQSGMLDTIGDFIMEKSETASGFLSVVHISVLINILGSLIMAAILYLLTRHFLKKRLNLA